MLIRRSYGLASVARPDLATGRALGGQTAATVARRRYRDAGCFTVGGPQATSNRSTTTWAMSQSFRLVGVELRILSGHPIMVPEWACPATVAVASAGAADFVR
jgi:hypothetical protein